VRWREERARGVRGEEAIVAAMSTAGRAVVFSGTAVAVGLLCLMVVPVPFLRSLMPARPAAAGCPKAAERSHSR
jgi:putative drug exporter of the RND superfamily